MSHRLSFAQKHQKCSRHCQGSPGQHLPGPRAPSLSCLPSLPLPASWAAVTFMEAFRMRLTQPWPHGCPHTVPAQPPSLSLRVCFCKVGEAARWAEFRRRAWHEAHGHFWAAKGRGRHACAPDSQAAALTPRGTGSGGGVVGRRLGPEGGAPRWGEEVSLANPPRPEGWDAQASAVVRAPGRTVAPCQVWVLLIQEVGAQALRGARAPRFAGVALRSLKAGAPPSPLPPTAPLGQAAIVRLPGPVQLQQDRALGSLRG